MLFTITHNMKTKSTILGLLSFLGISCSDNEEENNRSMFFWEENYLMVEIISRKNLGFVTKESKRIQDFGKEHFDGNGFTEITEIGQIPVPTVNLKLNKNEVVKLLESTGLSKYPKLIYYGVVEPKEIENPKSIVYGDLSSGIFLEPKDEILEYIWFDSYNWKEINQTNLEKGLNALGQEYDLILVDWNSSQIVDLKSEIDINEYLKPR